MGNEITGAGPDGLNEEQRVFLTLAYYDARAVPDTKLVQIFRCTAEQLAIARQDERYKEFLANETTEIVNRDAELDDSWDSLERRAVGALVDSVDSIGDPRMLLGIAVKANVATRRAGQLAKAQQKHGPAVINVNAQLGQTRVVRMRTKFLEALQEADGSRKLVQRETEIVTEDQGDLNEVISPTKMKGLLRNSLGVETQDMILKKSFGPDVDFTLDFSDLPEE